MARDVTTVDCTPIERIQTGCDVLDWSFGHSIIEGKHVYGIPLRRLSVVAGSAGVGKSRWAIKITQNISNQYKVLWFQNEVGDDQFGSWFNTKDVSEGRVFVSNATDLETQISEIKEIKPVLVFIDSVNMLDDYSGGRGEGVKKIIDAYRSLLLEINCHVCFLGQYTSDNKIRGGTALPHMVDVTCIMTEKDDEKIDDEFLHDKNLWGGLEDRNPGKSIQLIIQKNRCGPSGRRSFWVHLDDELYDSLGGENNDDEEWLICKGMDTDHLHTEDNTCKVQKEDNDNVSSVPKKFVVHHKSVAPSIPREPEKKSFLGKWAKALLTGNLPDE